MEDRTLLSCLALIVVGSRLLHRKVRTGTLEALARGGGTLPFERSFELEGRLESLQAASRDGGVPWLPKAWLLRHEGKGKRAVFETVSPWRKMRRYHAVQARGGMLVVRSVPASSDLVNLLTLAFLGTGLGMLGHAGWPFFAVVLGVLALDFALRTLVPARFARRDLERFLAA